MPATTPTNAQKLAAREGAHTTLARPKSPCGRTISAAMSTTNATTGL